MRTKKPKKKRVYPRLADLTEEQREYKRKHSHDLYMMNREKKLAYQKQYYREHYDECRKRIRACQSRRQVVKLRASIQEQAKERNYG